jgi:hypothetical protein
MEARNEESPERDSQSSQRGQGKCNEESFAQPKDSVNGLFAETLRELHEFLKRVNEEHHRKELARRLDDIDRRRWGYPPLRTCERRSRYAA